MRSPLLHTQAPIPTHTGTHSSLFPLPPRYLEREKVVAGDKHSYTFRWGPRSHQEVDKEAMLGLVAEIYEGDIEQWKRQFADLL